MPELVTLQAIEAAASRIRGVARLTPMLDLAPPDGSLPIRLKCENLQPIGAFKIRGAYNMVVQLTDEERRRGVITYSSGNHGQAVALAAKLLGASAIIVMPTTAPRVKVEGARELGATVIFEGTTSIERKARAEAEVWQQGVTMIPPFDHEWIIAGQGTIGLEIVDQCPEAATVLVPVGGGGLIAGVAAAIKQTNPSIRVVGVEPTGAARMKASIEAGAPCTLDRVSSIADGLMPVRPGDLTFAHARAFVDAFVAVDDTAIARAVLWLHRRAKLVVEPSGAATVAAAHRLAVEHSPLLPREGDLVAILSGGNMAPDTLAACVQLARR